MEEANGLIGMVKYMRQSDHEENMLLKGNNGRQ